MNQGNNRKGTDIKAILAKALSPHAKFEDRKRAADLPTVSQRMHEQWNNCPTEFPTKPGLEERMWAQISQRCRERRYRLPLKRMGWGVAAAILTLLLVMSEVWKYGSKEGNDIQPTVMHEIRAESLRKIVLPDSTHVWLAGGSTLYYKETFAETRHIWMTGEATFDVRHDANRPFKVYLNHTFVEVKGTVFKVLNRNGLPQEVDLFQGKVAFNLQDSGKVIPMQANQCLTYNEADGQTELTTLKGLGWKNGKYVFDNMPLKNLIQIVCRLYHTKLTTDTSINAEEKFCGYIEMDEPLQEILDKLCYSLGVQCKQTSYNSYLLY